MKKEIFIVGMLLITTLFSFKLFIKNQKTKMPPMQVYESLNGINQSDASNDTIDFKNNYYLKKKIPKVNFWFRSRVLEEMVKLLHDEKKAQITTNSPHKVDGIRIYLIHDNTSKYGLLLVTTVDSVSPNINDTRKLHHDYFLHDSSEPLFSDNDIGGSSSSFTNRKKGERLFSGDLIGADNGCIFDASHPSYVRTNDAFVIVRNFGDDVFNTKAEWYSTEFLENVIKEEPRCDGIRIYLARHNNEPSDFSNRDGFIITTTQNDPNDATNHNDYFDCNTKFTKPKSHPKGKQKGYEIIPYPPQNNGGLCPNNCN